MNSGRFCPSWGNLLTLRSRPLFRDCRHRNRRSSYSTGNWDECATCGSTDDSRCSGWGMVVGRESGGRELVGRESVGRELGKVLVVVVVLVALVLVALELVARGLVARGLVVPELGNPRQQNQ